MRMIRLGMRSFAIILLFSALIHMMEAQISYGGRPSGLEANSPTYIRKATSTALTRQVLPPVDSAAIYALEEAYWSDRLRGAVPFAVERHMNSTPMSQGSIYTDGQGREVWQLWIESSGAQSLNFTFDRFKLPRGARLYIYTPSGKTILGAFTEANNPDNAPFATAPLPGDQAVIECVLPTGMTFEDFVHRDFALRLSAIHHDYKGFFDLAKSLRAYKPGEPWFTINGLSCTPPVVTHPEVEKQSRATVLVIARGGLVFSGSLINNVLQDGAPYVLTASHCMNSNFNNEGDLPYSQRTAATCVFFFGFDSPSATTMIRGAQERTLSGAKLKVLNEDYDLCLLRITGMPRSADGQEGMIPASYMPYFAGWNTSSSPLGPFVGIHHPLSSVKRYSRYDARSLNLATFEAGRLRWENRHWRIAKWDIGTTAGGSSGSPLFDKDGLIIGALSGGQSRCSTPYNDYYYALSLAYKPDGEMNPQRMLMPHLDPNTSGRRMLSGYDPYAPHTARRISRVIYSSKNNEIEAIPMTEASRLRGLATGYQFPSKVRVLGVHIVMTSLGADQFPALKLSIFQGKKQPEIELYSSTVSYPAYAAWSNESSKFVRRERTMTDTLDFFIPIHTADGAEYIDVDGPVHLFAAIQAEGSDAVRLPILRLKTENAGAEAAYHLPMATGQWLAASSDIPVYKGNYWIDLIVQPIGEKGGLPSSDDVVTIRMVDNALRIVAIGLPTSDQAPRAEVYIYDYAGQRLYSSELKGYRNSLNVYDLLGAGSFILRLDYGGRKYVQKIQIQP